MDSLPPGFHFFPSDEELVEHFLYRKVASLPCQPPIIPTLDLKLYEPWELHGKALQSGSYWYFFTRKTTNRVSNYGYWNDCDTDKPVTIGNDIVGLKKTFVFYQAPEEIKTNWVMHEYHLLHAIARYNSSNNKRSSGSSSNSSRSAKKRREPKIECNKWALCRVSEANHDAQTGLFNDDEAELSCLDEVFLSLDDLDEISLLK